MFDLDFLAQFVVYHWLFMVLSGAEDSGRLSVVVDEEEEFDFALPLM